MKSILLIPFLIGIHCQAQITGSVTDSKTKKPISDVEVFIHGKAPFAMTNAGGQFALDGIHPGFADLVLYKKGYQLFKSSIRLLAGKAYALNLTIEPAPKGKTSKTSKGEDWSGAIQQLGTLLLGMENGSCCSIMNVEAVSFEKTPEGIIIKSSDPILIDDNSLGYHVLFYLQSGLLNAERSHVQGYYTFLPMKAQRSDQLLQWASNRLNMYEGSERHLFKSLIEGKIENAGFSLR